MEIRTPTGCHLDPGTLDQGLYDYQKDGWRFLSAKKHALLADEMGLGKTIQAIRGLNSVHAKKVLIICPQIVRHNWAEELKRFSLTPLKTTVLEKLDDLPGREVTVCTFNYVAENAKALAKQDWDAVIVDESHFLKSHTTKRSKAVLGSEGLVHKTKRLWFLSGTPMPNHPGELWLMFYVWGVTRLTFEEFVVRFCLTRETKWGLKILGADPLAIPELKKLLSNVMLRRTKKEAGLDLPPIHHYFKKVEPGLVPYETLKYYSEYFLPYPQREALNQRIQEETILLKTIWYAGGDSDHRTTDIKRIECLQTMKDSLVFARKDMGLKKIEGTVEQIRNSFASKHFKKCIVFAWHRDVIDQLSLELRDLKPVKLFGGTSPQSKERNLKKFKSNHGCKVLLAQILAAGTGINLTHCRDIYFIEQDWVPANNAQAIMRCHRIGQTKPVRVRYMSLDDPLDIRMTSVLKSKAQDFTKIFD